MESYELSNKSTSTLLGDNILEFKTPLRNFSIIWFADGHFDNPKSKLSFLYKVLKDNPESYIWLGGDALDVMSWNQDKRFNKDQLKNRKLDKPIFTEIQEFFQDEILRPYKDRIIGSSIGNHESKLIEKLEYDLHGAICNGFCNRLYTRGYIKINHIYSGGSHGVHQTIFFQHSPPSGGIRSKGMLSVDLLLGQRPDADIIITEHIHNTWIKPETVQRINFKTNKEYYKNVWFIQAPTMKAEHEGKNVEYFHERIKQSATTIGAIKIDFKVIRDKDNDKRVLLSEPRYLLAYNY